MHKIALRTDECKTRPGQLGFVEKGVLENLCENSNLSHLQGLSTKLLPSRKSQIAGVNDLHIIIQK